MGVRSRAVAGAVGFLVFVLLGRMYEPELWTAWWFYVGLGTALSAVFVEPFFNRPQDAIVNGAGALAAYWAAERSGTDVLWTGFAVVACLAALSGMASALLTPRFARIKALSFRVAGRAGRAIVLGTSALVLEALGQLDAGGEYLVLGAVALGLSLVIDWAEILALISPTSREALGTAVAAFGPRMLLVDGTGIDLKTGDRVDLTRGNRQSGGTVISRMPHKTGLRYQVALDADWDKLCTDFPAPVRLVQSMTTGQVVGTVGEGTTDTLLHFEPVRPLRVGYPVEIRTGEGKRILYQVTEVRLRRVGWEGSAALIPHAVAMHVGAPDDGYVRFQPRLPFAHQVVELAADLSMALPDGYARLGVAQGTQIEVGVDFREASQGHLAILGMSGMGKTSVANRICTLVGASCWVVAIDTTGEYRTRLSFPEWPGEYTGVGYWVHEPAGDPPKKAAELIENSMKAAFDEYAGGATPERRVLLMEEAHSFVPEWNFATKNQQDSVSFSARMVMQSRKFELSFIVVSQRTAVVSKSVLSQCENYVILKTVDETSLSYLEGIFGSVIRQAVPSLARYEAICAGPAFNSEGPVITRLDPPSGLAAPTAGAGASSL